MKSNISKVITGLGIGLAVGSAGALVSGSVMSGGTKKFLKKKAEKTFKAVGNFVDDIQSLLK